jgi:hypothetical protein
LKEPQAIYPASGQRRKGAQDFLWGTAGLSTLTPEHNPSEPAIGLWNDIHHVNTQCLEGSN